MYIDFFGLREKPFALSPDPRFLYLSEAHREALAHLLYGIEQGEGFIAVTGEVGTGKTTLCRTLLRRLGGEVEVAFLFNPKLSAQELLESMLLELGVELPDGKRSGSARELVDTLNQFLLERRAAGKRVLLILDEAQGLLPETLEQIRLLSNLETESDKLIQILLLGQPELDTMLESADLRQLRQRIGVRWRLEPLAREETAAYVRHRLHVAAGVSRDHVFSDAALADVFRFSAGVPRVVNLLCDRALLGAYAEGRAEIGSDVVRRAARELGGNGAQPRSRARRWLAPALAAAGLAAALAAVLLLGGPRVVAERLGLPFAFSDAPAAGAGGADSEAAVADRVSAPAEAEGVLETRWVRDPLVDAGTAPPEASTTRAPDPESGSDLVSGSAALPAVAAAPPVAAPPVAEAAGVPHVEDLALALARRAPGASAAEALAAVLGAWSVAPTDARPELLSFPELVGALARHDLEVFSFTASDLDQLRSLDHPVLLDVEAADGIRRVVALRQIGAGEVELDGVVAGGPVRVAQDELDRLWPGDAHVVWRDFEPLPELLLPGDAGEGVQWLQQALAEVGYAPGPATGFFDANTEDAVRAFQADSRLEPDGAVGPLTKMALYGALDRYGVPRLVLAGTAGDSG